MDALTFRSTRPLHRRSDHLDAATHTQEENMENEDHGGKQDQLEEHTLPGTNQAGKGPGAGEKDDQENKPGGRGAQRQEQLEEQSLPGTKTTRTAS